MRVLNRHESRNITFMEPDGSWPIVWERAQGMHVWDVAGKKYLDLTAAFGVATAGHANRRVVDAGKKQMGRLLHAMGDVHPHRLKAQLARELSRITFERWCRDPGAREFAFPPKAKLAGARSERCIGKTIFCNSGFESVEAAFKTSVLATAKKGVIAFSGAYHGLGYGALNATHRDHFRVSFRSQIRHFTHFAPFPERSGDLHETESVIRYFFRKASIGAILVEPIQARGGIRIPPPGFLPLLRKLCDENGALLVLDEVYTGFGRTGKWFACELFRTVPDIICLGKALTGGFPLSACVARAEVMDAAWPPSTGEAIHTSTFLGHPVGCAMALAQIKEIRNRKLVEQSAAKGRKFLRLLEKEVTHPRLKIQVRGIGLMAGLELQTPEGEPATAEALQAIKAMLREGYILLPEGEFANVISFTPPLIVSEKQLTGMVKALAKIVARL